MSAFRRWDPIWDISGAKWGVRIKGEVLPFPLPSCDCKSCGGNTPVPFCLKDYLPDKSDHWSNGKLKNWREIFGSKKWEKVPGNNLRAFNCVGGSLQPWHQGDNEQGEDAQATHLRKSIYEQVSPSKMGFQNHCPQSIFVGKVFTWLVRSLCCSRHLQPCCRRQRSGSKLFLIPPFQVVLVSGDCNLPKLRPYPDTPKEFWVWKATILN